MKAIFFRRDRKEGCTSKRLNKQAPAPQDLAASKKNCKKSFFFFIISIKCVVFMIRPEHTRLLVISWVQTCSHHQGDSSDEYRMARVSAG